MGIHRGIFTCSLGMITIPAIPIIPTMPILDSTHPVADGDVVGCLLLGANGPRSLSCRAENRVLQNLSVSGSPVGGARAVSGAGLG